MKQGDVVIMETAGGGGYGLPEERALEAIAADVKAGYISKRWAQERYQVVFRGDVIDAAATEMRRRERALTRTRLRVEAVDEDSFWEGRRRFQLHQKTCQAFGIDASRGRETLVELLNLNGAPLRGWAVSADDGNEGSIRLGPVAQRILRVSAGDAVTLCVLDGGDAHE